MAEPLTVRIADRVRVSRDTGESCWLDGRDANRLRDVLQATPVDLVHDQGAPTACTLASIGEGAHAQPLGESVFPSLQYSAPTVRVHVGGLVRRLSRAFASVLELRYSARDVGPLALADLATVLVRSGRVHSWEDLPNGNQLVHRPVPSAGGCHPCSLFVAASGVEGLGDGWWRFDPLSCALESEDVDPGPVSFLARQQFLVGAARRPTAAIAVVAEFARTLMRYPAGTVHVWRDAGVLLGTVHLTASDIGLKSVITGGVGLVTSERWRDATVDVGAVILGR